MQKLNREVAAQILALFEAQPQGQPITNLLLYCAQGEIDIRTTVPTDLPSVGDKVYYYGDEAPDGEYLVYATGARITTKGGKIVDIEMPDTPTDAEPEPPEQATTPQASAKDTPAGSRHRPVSSPYACLRNLARSIPKAPTGKAANRRTSAQALSEEIAAFRRDHHEVAYSLRLVDNFVQRYQAGDVLDVRGAYHQASAVERHLLRAHLAEILPLIGS